MDTKQEQEKMEARLNAIGDERFALRDDGFHASSFQSSDSILIGRDRTLCPVA